jgi:hypothetical protein
MTLPIPAGGQWVDRHQLVASRHQRPDQQPTIQLDADHDLLRLAGVGSEQPMQLGQTGDPSGTLRRPSTTRPGPAPPPGGPRPSPPDKITRPPRSTPLASPRSPAATEWTVPHGTHPSSCQPPHRPAGAPSSRRAQRSGPEVLPCWRLGISLAHNPTDLLPLGPRRRKPRGVGQVLVQGPAGAALGRPVAVGHQRIESCQ